MQAICFDKDYVRIHALLVEILDLHVVIFSRLKTISDKVANTLLCNLKSLICVISKVCQGPL